MVGEKTNNKIRKRENENRMVFITKKTSQLIIGRGEGGEREEQGERTGGSNEERDRVKVRGEGVRGRAAPWLPSIAWLGVAWLGWPSRGSARPHASTGETTVATIAAMTSPWHRPKSWPKTRTKKARTTLERSYQNFVTENLAEFLADATQHRFRVCDRLSLSCGRVCGQVFGQVFG